ncbi:MAG TPA: hypothetical protein VFO49_11930 [Nocardioides sp.]|nr:hypothetical protein [Nocardioides sp.]
MPTYGDLPALMRTMTEAAIDAELRELEWFGDAATGYHSEGYGGRLPPVSPSTGEVTIDLVLTDGTTPSGGPLPPGARLVSDDPIQVTGGLKYQYRVDAGEAIYGPWFERINAAFERWRDLPDPALFDEGVAGLAEAIDQLTMQPGDTRTGTVPAAEADLVSLVDNNLAAIKPEQGRAAFAFTSVYGAVRTASVIGNQRELLIALGAALAAEKSAWEAVRKSVVSVAENATSAFASAGGQVDFGAVKGFLEVLSGVLPAGKGVDLLAKAIKVSGFLALVTQSRPAPPDPYQLAGGSPDEVYDHLLLALERLDDDITEAEKGVRDLLDNAVAKASASHERADYHISPGAGVDTRPDNTTVGDVDWSAPGQIHVIPEVYQDVGLRTMPSIAAFLESASDLADRSSSPTAWLRVGAVGSGGQYGPFYNSYVDFLELVTSVLSSSAAEIIAAGEKLAIAAGFIGDADAEARGAFDRKAGSISPPGGSGPDDPLDSTDLDDDPLGWPDEANPRTPPVYDPNHPVASPH